MTTAASLERAERTLTALGVDDAERTSFLDNIRRVEDGHGIRSAPMRQNEEFMRELAPDQVGRLRELASIYPRPAPFTPMPLGDFLSLAAITFVLVEPDRPLTEASAAVSRRLAPKVAESVIMKSALIASEGELGRFLQVIARGSASISNFGRIHCDRLGKSEWCMRYEEWYDFYPYYSGTVGFMTGLIDMFGHEGEVEMVDIDPMTFEMIIRWE